VVTCPNPVSASVRTPKPTCLRFSNLFSNLLRFEGKLSSFCDVLRSDRVYAGHRASFLGSGQEAGAEEALPRRQLERLFLEIRAVRVTIVLRLA